MRLQTITVPTVGANPGFIATQSYVYDNLNRIRSATETISGTETWKQTFEIDRYGNREFDPANTTTLGTCQQTICNPDIRTSDNRFSDGQGYLYDSTGNITRDATGQRFGYDASNKQTTFFDSTNGGTEPNATYHYDGEGKRIKKVVGTEVTIFVYDGLGKLVAEYTTTVVPVEQAKVSYLTTDHLGSPRIVTDRDGRVISRKDFTAFGEEVVTPDYRKPGTNGNGYDPPNVRQDYTGYQKDNESGLEFAQNRYYNTGHGRFTSVDPLTPSATIKNPQTFNRYSYVTNSPYKFTDPLGLMQSDASLNWANVAGSFWGNDLNSRGASPGQQIITAADALYDRATFKNQSDASLANHLARQGQTQQAQAIVDANENLEKVEAREARTETSVRVVDDGQETSGSSNAGPLAIRIIVDIQNKTLEVIGSEADTPQVDSTLLKTGITSGKGDCINSTACESKKNEGPTPRGEYTLDKSDLTEFSTLGSLYRNLSADWGSFRVPLRPAEGNKAAGRDGFYIHGGNFDGSAGCIDIGGGSMGNITTRTFIRLVQSSKYQKKLSLLSREIKEMNRYVRYLIAPVMVVNLACSNAALGSKLDPEVAMKKFYSFQGSEEQLMDPLILAGDDVIPLVKKEVENKEMPRRRYAIGFLGNSGGKGEINTLEKILNDSGEDDVFRGDALVAIFQIDVALGKQHAKQYESNRSYLGLAAADILSDKAYLHHRREVSEALRSLPGILEE